MGQIMNSKNKEYLTNQKPILILAFTIISSIIVFATVILVASIIDYPYTRTVVILISLMALFLIIVIIITLYYLKKIKEKDLETKTNNEIFLKNAPLNMSIWDKNLKLVTASQQAAKMFGLSSSEQFITQFHDLSPEYQPCGAPSHEKSLYYVSKAFDEGKTTFEWMHKTLDGSPIPTEIVLTRYIDKDVPYIVSFAIDLRPTITAQKQEFEKKLNQTLQTIIDAAPFGCYITDENNNILNCNHAIIKLFNLKDQEEYKTRYLELSPKHQPCGTLSQEKMDQFIKQTFEKGSAQFEWTYQTLDGTPIPVEVNFIHTNIDGKSIKVGYLRDLYDFHKYKEIKREADERLKLMINTIPLIITYWGSDYSIKEANKTGVDFYGYASKEEGLKRAHKEILDNTDWYNRLDEIFENGSASFVYEDALSHFWEVEGVRTTYNGETVAVTYGKNITHLKELQEEQRRREIAEESNKAKTMFIANISHEIRTPMNSILGYSELALEDVIPNTTREYLSRILTNSKWLINVVNNVLDISKIESGLLELDLVVFDIYDLIEQCQYLMLPSANDKKLNLSFNIEASALQGKYLIGDSTKINQVCTNILSNAIKFTENGGAVTVTVIAKELDENNCKLSFEFKDTGIGMNEEQISRVFDSFMQADSSTTRKYGGTGLGLAITKRLLNMMDSDLLVQSTLGLGSKFFFTINLMTVDVEMYLSSKPTNKNMILTKPIFNKEEILVVDDNDMNLGVVCEHLKRVGLTPTIAMNGKEAVDKVKQRIDNGEAPYDLIFMDLHMPIMDGKEAASIITNLNIKTPIVAMSAGIINPTDNMLFANFGSNHYLSKPFTKLEMWQGLLEYFQPINNTNVYRQGSLMHNYIVEEELLKELKFLFVKGNQNTIENFTNFLEEGNIRDAYILVHTLKNSALLIDKIQLSNISKEVEALLSKAELPNSELINKLTSELRLVLDELDHLLN